MKKILIVFLLTCLSQLIIAQNLTEPVRFIEVTGSAETEIEPDEIRFQIGIQEYFKEEYEQGKVYKDFITKIPIEEIEKKLMSSLAQVGIKKEQIIVKEVGRSWNMSGKNFKKSKSIELIIKDFKIINALLTQVKVKGLNSMKIAELKNKNISDYRKKVKIEAMKAAKNKATYLLESVDESIGKVISVIELNANSGSNWRPQNYLSNTKMASESNELTSDNIRKIKLKYEIKIRFEIN